MRTLNAEPDAVDEMSKDADFVEKLCREKPSLARSIINAIKSVLRKLRQALSPGVVYEEYRDAFFSQINMWDEAQRLWMKAAKAAQKENANRLLDERQRNSLRLSIHEGMTDAERTSELRNKSLNTVVSNSKNLDLSNESIENLQSRAVAKAKKEAVRLAQALSVSGAYENRDKVISNAVLIRQYTDEEYSNENPEHKRNPNLKYTYVLVSAIEDGENIIPVKLTVMEYRDNVSPKIHVAMTGSEIKKAGIITTSWNDSAQVATPSSTLNLAKLLPEIKDKDFVKHIPYALRGVKLSVNDDISAEEYTPELADQEAADLKYSAVEDPKLIEQLESDRHKTACRAMALIDGKLYPPMATKKKNDEGKGF